MNYQKVLRSSDSHHYSNEHCTDILISCFGVLHWCKISALKWSPRSMLLLCLSAFVDFHLCLISRAKTQEFRNV